MGVMGMPTAGSEVTVSRKLIGRSSGSRAALVACGMVILLKVWLTAREEIVPRFAPHDDLLYAQLAETWYWGMPYGVNTLIRAPGFPLWIALTRQTGLPHRLAAELLYLVAAGVLTASLRRIGMRRWLACAAFAAIALHPASIPQLNQLVREGFYASILLINLAAVCSGLRRLPAVARGSWLGMGMASAILWHTRDESVLVAAHVVATLVSAVWLCKHAGIQWRETISRCIMIGAMIIVPIGLANAAIRLATWSTHGVAIVDELGSRVFRAAFNALLRVQPSAMVKHVPVTHATTGLIAQQSPAFAMLMPLLDNGITARWEAHYRPFAKVEGEVTGGGYVWALREAADQAGFHRDAGDAAAFYSRLANEITGAVEDARLPSRTVPVGMLDPQLIRRGADLPKALAGVLADFFPRRDRAREPASYPTHQVEATLQTYERVTLARRDLWRARIPTASGWIFVPGIELASLRVLSAEGEALAATGELLPRKDVVAASEGLAPLRCGFTLELPVDSDARGSVVELIATEGKRWKIEAARFTRRGPEMLPLGGGVQCRLCIDRVTAPRGNDLREGCQNLLWRAYSPALAVASTLVALWIVVAVVSRRQAPPVWYGAAGIVGLSLALRVALLSVLDLTWMHHAYRHFFPSAILFPVVLALLVEVCGLRRSRSTASIASMGTDGPESHIDTDSDALVG